MKRTRAAGEKIVVVAGPAVVHSGGDSALGRLVRDGWVDVLLSGNAFATHDLEKAIVGTSLGVCQMSGRAVEGGSRNHLFAINAVNRAGGIRRDRRGRGEVGGHVRDGEAGIPFVLAGSIRDDGPLKDVITDIRDAQMAYAKALEGAGVLPDARLGAPRHRGGEPLPVAVRTVCVDMTESVPVKLGNRGTMQAIGLVTDVGYFLEKLRAELQ